MRDCAGVEAERQVGLVEQVLARGEVVVGRDRDLGAIGGDRARIDVLEELVLIGPACAVAQRDAFAERMVEQGIERIDAGPRSAERRVGTEWVSTCRARWLPEYENKKKK